MRNGDERAVEEMEQRGVEEMECVVNRNGAWKLRRKCGKDGTAACHATARAMPSRLFASHIYSAREW